MSASRLSAIVVAIAAALPSSGAGAPRTHAASSVARPTRIVFTASIDSNRQVYSVLPSGRGLAQLTFHRASATDPAPSPDGSLIVYRRSRLVLVMDADGRNVRALRIGAAATTYAWHPDSRRLAYVRGGDIREIGADGKRDRLLAREPGGAGTIGAPVWSPDGRSLAFFRNRSVVVRTDGSEHRVLRLAGYVRPIAWSPDGRWLACLWSPPAQQPPQIVLVHPDGTGRRVVGPGRMASWSPEGQQLAYADGSQLKVLTVATGEQQSLSKTAFNLALLAWSPTGEEIAYYSHQAGPALRLMAVSSTGRVRHLLSRFPFDGDSLAWTSVPKGLRLRPPTPLELGSAEELRLRVPVRELAADGNRVAYRVCQTIGTWRAGDTRPTTVRAEPSFLCRESSLIFYSLAIAGSRIAWGAHDGGNVIEANWLSVADLRAPGTETLVASNGPRGNFRDAKRAGHILGDGSLLAFSTWAYCDGSAADTCNDMPARPVSQSLWLTREPSWPGACPLHGGNWSTEPVIVNGRCQLLRTEPGPLTPFDADAGRILAGGTNATLVVDAEGRGLLSVPVSATSGELSGRDLVLVRGGELRRYEATTGAFIRSYSLPGATTAELCGKQCFNERIRLEDLARGLVLYRLDSQVHVLRLGDGADAVVATGTAARFGDAGLYYAYETTAPWRGRIRFVPFDELPLR